MGESIRSFSDLDVSFAVDTGKGLITPIVKNADVVGLGTISSKTKVLI